ncbi:dihydrolipoyl dehydrogenase [Thermoflavimicrobium dichotomicum]|uniref:Dihydrolipoyl dehydrogenase n=1 Tax=Thermoflavimicrobium dichotomicum TaxID=46223 RepID=A0A1I3Q8H2_9BACL|nr:dihydrolipoyl dehydrogenase [Thermoflavimicrobium dichotomicum]SFJ29939.1 dihydrolipoamide dehydrogenase [Thermoflavimicrobium dichotomicum]
MDAFYDLAIIGGGTGGYTAAIRAAKKGLKVLLIEKDKLGGTCLHKGCIPTKTLLECSSLFNKINSLASDWGIEIEGNPQISVEKLMKRKEAVIHQLYQGIQYLMKKNKIQVESGFGKITKHDGRDFFVQVRKEKEVLEFKTSNVIIATGSKPALPSPLKLVRNKVVTSDQMLDMDDIPGSIAILGGGVIGVEFATIFHEIGSKVKIIEQQNRLLPFEDEDISKEMKRIMTKKKIELLLDSKANLEGLNISDTGVQIPVLRSGHTEFKVEADLLLIAVGRTNNIKDIGLEQLGIDISQGFVPVNEFQETTIKGLYAIGDITGSYQLAHVAAHQGIIAVDHMTESEVHPYQPLLVPRCVYSHPQVASIGLTEQEAIQKGLEIKVGKFPFKGIGRALTLGNSDGFAKLICDARTDQIIGVHIIGTDATELIGEQALGMLLEATAWEVSLTIHPHPTLNEIFGEAALAVEGQEING